MKAFFNGDIRAFQILYTTVNAFQKIDHDTESKKRCGSVR